MVRRGSAVWRLSAFACLIVSSLVPTGVVAQNKKDSGSGFLPADANPPLPSVTTSIPAATPPAPPNVVPALSTTSLPKIVGDENLQTFLNVLKEYKRITEHVSSLTKGDKTFEHIDPRLVANLSPSVLLPRYKKFNVDYISRKKNEAAKTLILKKKNEELRRTPITDLAKRPQLELVVKALQDNIDQLRLNLFLISVEANQDIEGALATLTPAQKSAALTVTANAESARPKMPGVFGETRGDRMKKTDTDKPNLSPVDPEFAKTKLGEKISKDLGGDIQSWSYDYDNDRLYVQVNNEVGMVRVKQEGGSARFVQTRVGKDFVEPVGSDMKVDINAKGRFLTGNKSEDNLFGKFDRSDNAAPEPTGPHTETSAPATSSGGGH